MRHTTVILALAALSASAVAVPQSAFAAHHKRMQMKMAKQPKLVPSQPKPGYRSMVGTPSLIDPVPVAAKSGVLGLGLIPSTNMFKGVPVLGDIGL